MATDPRALAEEILALDAEATPGPWVWEMNPEAPHVRLCSATPWRPYVMRFVRWGMQGGAPCFRDFAEDVMKRVEHFAKVIPGREHHASWAKDIDHPDANLLARYRQLAPDLARAVVEADDAVDYRERWLDALSDVVAYGGHTHADGTIDSCAHRTVMEAMVTLAEHGRLILDGEPAGRRAIGRWAPTAALDAGEADDAG